MMNGSWRETSVQWLVGAAMIGCAACSADAPGCPADNVVWGECAGVASTGLTGPECTSVIDAGSDAELASAIKSASAGACIALSSGHYSAVVLPGGVSLLGPSAIDATIDGITLSAGNGAAVRSLAVGAHGIDIQGATAVRIEAVRITGSADVQSHGVALSAGSSATIAQSEIVDAGRAGVYAVDADVTLDHTIISGATSTGVWIAGSQCDATCACSHRPTLTATDTAIRDNFVLGIVSQGASVKLSSVDVTGTRSGHAILTGRFGGGVSASACSDVSAKQVRVLDNADWGILVDGSTAMLGAEGENGTLEVSRNLRGVWIQNVPCTTTSCVMVENSEIAENLAIGVGIAKSSRGIILCRSRIQKTKNYPLPVFLESDVGGSQEVGDGVNWLDDSTVTIDQITLGENERQSVLIDGSASGSISALKFEGADQMLANPVLQQNVMAGGTTPTIDVPPELKTIAMREFGIPQSLPLPTAVP